MCADVSNYPIKQFLDAGGQPWTLMDYDWRRGWDSNPRYGLSPYNGLANRRLQPLGHPSGGSGAI
jgi:hypothetical protein